MPSRWAALSPTPDSPSSNSENCFERLQPMPRGLYDARSGVGLLVCVIAGANQRTGRDMKDADLEECSCEKPNLVGRVKPRHGKVVPRRPQVLADGEDVHIVVRK